MLKLAQNRFIKAKNSKIFPGLRPWTPLGGLQRPPNPQLLLTRSAPFGRSARITRFARFCSLRSPHHPKSQCGVPEKGSFTPFVMSTSGGMGTEAELFVKRIAILIAAKRNEEYYFVVNYIRMRLRFCMLKSVLLSLRAERGKKVTTRHTPLSNLSFNLIQFDDS